MKIERFEDIMAWQKARELTIRIFGVFGASKDFGFRDQICRASVSIMNVFHRDNHWITIIDAR